MKKAITSIIIMTLIFGIAGCTNKPVDNKIINSNNISENSDIIITIDDKELTGILLDTELAKEIKTYFPLTVKMVKYSNREYYGEIDFEPVTISRGKKNFEDGDITYCPQNNSLAIFYNGKELPNLTMDVIKIGEITSNLDAFYEAESSEEITFQFTK